MNTALPRIAVTLAVLAAAIVPALAAEPAKLMETSVGKVYVDAKGMTLYTFDKDQKGVSNCYDQCAVNWPPFLATADAKVSGDWTLVVRKDGSKMWAHAGMPLYTFIKDKKSGDVTGDGVGGVWHVAQ